MSISAKYCTEGKTAVKCTYTAMQTELAATTQQREHDSLRVQKHQLKTQRQEKPPNGLLEITGKGIKTEPEQLLHHYETLVHPVSTARGPGPLRTSKDTAERAWKWGSGEQRRASFMSRLLLLGTTELWPDPAWDGVLSPAPLWSFPGFRHRSLMPVCSCLIVHAASRGLLCAEQPQGTTLPVGATWHCLVPLKEETEEIRCEGYPPQLWGWREVRKSQKFQKMQFSFTLLIHTQTP